MNEPSEAVVVNGIRFTRYTHEDRVAELERENAELRRQNRIWEWRFDSIVRFVDGKPQLDCPELRVRQSDAV